MLLRGAEGGLHDQTEVNVVQPAFRATAGQVALIEPQEGGHPLPKPATPLTGVVGPGTDGELTIMGVSSSDLDNGTEVVVSIFAPEALYRIRAGYGPATPCSWT
jgi:hypothetical protein